MYVDANRPRAQVFDVAVNGAGPAGASIARRLTRLGWRVALVHRSASHPLRHGETLAPEVNPLLRELGLFEEFLATAPLESPGVVSAWGSSRADTRDFLSNPHGCGWHIDRDAFDEMLRANSGAWIAEHPPEARFSVDATGAASGPRDFADRTVAIVVELAGSHADLRTTVESVPFGWWYTAPIPRDRTMAMFFMDAATYSQSGAALAEALADAPQTRSRIGGAALTRTRTVAADTSIRRTLYGPNWVAIGDAASSLDPLSGWGIGKAFAESAEAALAVDAWLRGDTSKVEAFAARVRENYANHRAQRRAYYAMEQRWPASAFWARGRHDTIFNP